MPDLPGTLFFALASPAECDEFFRTFDPDARCVSDPEAFFYAAMGLERGGAGAFLSPAVFAAGLRAVVKGNGIGLPVGDVRRMPGAFLVKDGRLLYGFVAEHAGQHPDLAAVAEAARERKLSS